MHELGIMTGVMESVESVAREAGAERVLKVSLQVGVMTEAIEDALQFAFEALAENNDYFEGATLDPTEEYLYAVRSRIHARSLSHALPRMRQSLLAVARRQGAADFFHRS